MRAVHFAPSLVALVGILLIAPAVGAQSFNIDLDTTGTNQSLGNGVPSSAFGAAANQPGVWNSYLPTSNAVPLVDLSGAGTAVSVQVTATSTTVSHLAFNNAANSGDFRLLMNDGAQIGTTTQGGSRTYTFSGLANGPYSVVTYTGRPQGVDGHIIVDIPGSSEGPLVATGVPTGDTFTLGVTHVVHTLNVATSGFSILLTDIAGAPAGYVDGFQLTLVPEPAAMSGLALVASAMLRRRRD